MLRKLIKEVGRRSGSTVKVLHQAAKKKGALGLQPLPLLLLPREQLWLMVAPFSEAQLISNSYPTIAVVAHSF